MLRLSAIFAFITGAVLALGELRANWGDWQFWPLWLVDFAASALSDCWRVDGFAPASLGSIRPRIRMGIHVGNVLVVARHQP